MFKDQNLESARNLLRQSLSQRLQSMDRVDARRSIRARSLHRQRMQGASGVERNHDYDHTHSKRETLTKPSRPAPPPPLPQRNKNNTISTFTNLRVAKPSGSQNIDLNHSLNGPTVSYESTSLIHIKNEGAQNKPKLPPKPSHLNRVKPKNDVTDSSQKYSHTKAKFSNDNEQKDMSSCIPMESFSSNANDITMVPQNESNDNK